MGKITRAYVLSLSYNGRNKDRIMPQTLKFGPHRDFRGEDIEDAEANKAHEDRDAMEERNFSPRMRINAK